MSDLPFALCFKIAIRRCSDNILTFLVFFVLDLETLWNFACSWVSIRS